MIEDCNSSLIIIIQKYPSELVVHHVVFSVPRFSSVEQANCFFVWRQVLKLTVETVHLQHHVSLLSVGCPLQQGKRVSA